MSFHEKCLPSYGPICFLDCFFELIPSERNVLIFKMYFFPDDNIARSRETNALLLEVMDTQNSVMRIYFDGEDAVDLLIFTSKQLHLDSLMPQYDCLEYAVGVKDRQQGRSNTITSPSIENF